MKLLRILIVEDDKALLGRLEKEYRAIFESQGYASIQIEQAETVKAARELARNAKANAYDLVSLDINLGDTDLTGLDVLKTFERFQSAWMVVLLTGVETDASLDGTLGAEKANLVRTQLRKDAFERFPPERLIVVEKPSTALPNTEASQLLTNRLGQIALTYQHITRQRYIFKPIKVTSLVRVKTPKGERSKSRFVETQSTHWQLRFNCGEVRTLPDKPGFRTIHHLLKHGPEQSLSPIESLILEPKQEKNQTPENKDLVAEYFISRGVEWNQLSEAEKSSIIRAALSDDFMRYKELRGYQDDDDLSAVEADELESITEKLGALAEIAETGYQRLKEHEKQNISDEELTLSKVFQIGLSINNSGSKIVREETTGRSDTKEAENFRARWKRAKDYLRENGFAELAQHLEDYIQSTGANWSYNPPDGIEWTT